MNSYQERHKNNPAYKAKNAARARLWYEQNRERALDRIKQRALRTRIEKSAYDKDYYRRNRDKKLAYYHEWAKKNPDKVLINVRVWRENNPLEHRLHNQARRAKVNGIKIIKSDIRNWASKLCGICGTLIRDDFHIDHIKPLSRGGKHEVINLQLAHPSCNLRKHAKLNYELM